jgi:hypothetical protein
MNALASIAAVAAVGIMIAACARNPPPEPPRATFVSNTPAPPRSVAQAVDQCKITMAPKAGVELLGDPALPPPARLQVLLRLANDALARGDRQSALNLFAEMHDIKGVQRPLDVYIVEAKVAGGEKDFVRARCVLQAYFSRAKENDSSFQEAVDLYATLEALTLESSGQ